MPKTDPAFGGRIEMTENRWVSIGYQESVIRTWMRLTIHLMPRRVGPAARAGLRLSLLSDAIITNSANTLHWVICAKIAPKTALTHGFALQSVVSIAFQSTLKFHLLSKSLIQIQQPDGKHPWLSKYLIPSNRIAQSALIQASRHTPPFSPLVWPRTESFKPFLA